MTDTARDVEMIEALIQNDIDNSDPYELLRDLLFDGLIGYNSLTSTELEDELIYRGLPLPHDSDEM
jgi:hypothetical protein